MDVHLVIAVEIDFCEFACAFLKQSVEISLTLGYNRSVIRHVYSETLGQVVTDRRGNFLIGTGEA